MNSQLGPVVRPVAPQVLKTLASHGGELFALIGRDAARAPVQDRLRAFPKKGGKGFKTAATLDSGIELFSTQHVYEVNTKFSHMQAPEPTFPSGELHNPFMNSAWERVEGALEAHGKGLQWLANRIGCSIQRVQNWKTRGIPVSAYPEVAAAFEETIDWVAGLAPPKAGVRHLSSAALALGAYYDRLSPEEQKLLKRLIAAAAESDEDPPFDLPDPQAGPDLPNLGGMSGFTGLDEPDHKKQN